MGAGITLWGRNGHDESLQAIAYLKRHGFRADRLLDLDRQPPTLEEIGKIRLGLGGTLAAAASTGIEPPSEDWFLSDSSRFKAPILVTPKGTLVGFRENAWNRFFEIDKLHDPA